MADKVWVLAEQWRGDVTEVAREMLTLGREVASGAGASLEAVLLGHDCWETAAALPEADAVLYASHPAFADPVPEAHASALAQLVRERKPRCVLVPLTNLSMDVATLAAAMLDAPLISFCMDVRLAEGRVEAKSLLYGGKVEATVVASAGTVILAVLPGVRPAAEKTPGRGPSVEEVSVTVADTPGVRFLQLVEPPAGDVDITQIPVLVSVGRGIQNRDNIGLAEELAKALGGAVAGSRPVIDQGWLPMTRQVGKSGMNVKPKLYLALGISGAPEHLEGMKGSATIVAVNTDPKAPIFQVAHYGIVADLFEIHPPLTEQVLRKKG